MLKFVRLSIYLMNKVSTVWFTVIKAFLDVNKIHHAIGSVSISVLGSASLIMEIKKHEKHLLQVIRRNGRPI